MRFREEKSDRRENKPASRRPSRRFLNCAGVCRFQRSNCHADESSVRIPEEFRANTGGPRHMHRACSGASRTVEHRTRFALHCERSRLRPIERHRACLAHQTSRDILRTVQELSSRLITVVGHTGGLGRVRARRPTRPRMVVPALRSRDTRNTIQFRFFWKIRQERVREVPDGSLGSPPMVDPVGGAPDLAVARRFLGKRPECDRTLSTLISPRLCRDPVPILGAS
jgi:hypothetical protein